MRVSFAGHLGRKPTIPVGLVYGAQTPYTDLRRDLCVSQTALFNGLVQFTLGLTGRP